VLTVHALLAGGDATRPPIVLVHGAANSGVVGRLWQAHLAARGWPARALLDLRGHGTSQSEALGRATLVPAELDWLSRSTRAPAGAPARCAP